MKFNKFLNECIITRRGLRTDLTSSGEICETDIREQVLCDMDNKDYTTVLQYMKESPDVSDRFISCITIVRDRVRHRISANKSQNNKKKMTEILEKEIESRKREKKSLLNERNSLVSEISLYQDLMDIFSNQVLSGIHM